MNFNVEQFNDMGRRLLPVEFELMISTLEYESARRIFNDDPADYENMTKYYDAEEKWQAAVVAFREHIGFPIVSFE